jgi:hypothetical protein
MILSERRRPQSRPVTLRVYDAMSEAVDPRR